MKVIAVFILVIHHTYEGSLYLLDLSNAGSFFDWLNSYYGQVFANSIFAVDILLFVSGFLSNRCYPLFKKSSSYSSLSTKTTPSIDYSEYSCKKLTLIIINRYLRLVLPTIAIIAIFAPLLDLSSLYINNSSPQSVRANYYYSGTCRQYMWRNILMVSNISYYVMEICQAQTWQVSIDFQFFIFFRIVDIIIVKFVKKKIEQSSEESKRKATVNYLSPFVYQIYTYICICILGQLMTSYILYEYNLPAFYNKSFSLTTKKYIDYNIMIHANPIVKLSSYCIGCLTSMYIEHKRLRRLSGKQNKNPSDHVHINHRFRPNLSNLLVLVFISAIFLQPIVERYFMLTSVVNAIVGFFFRPLWCLCLSLCLIINCDRVLKEVKTKKTDELAGKKGFLTRLITGKIWFMLSNLSFSLALIHLNIIVISYGSQLISSEFSHLLWIRNGLGYMALSSILAVLFHLMIEVPLTSHFRIKMIC